ncbi:MAG: type II secretion system protein, partial [Patescibacteria group bacterium]
MRKVAGFTLIEALVVIAITGIMLGVLLANYRRSNENSLLIREVASVMSHIRLAQETAASSKI